MIREQFWLSEEQFARLEPLLATDTRGKPRVDDRRVISGIIHVLKSGCRWADAPEVYGPRKTLCNRFVRWAAKGVWVDIFHALAAAGGPPADGPLLLAVATYSRRKNLHLAVRLLAALAAEGLPARLCLVGRASGSQLPYREAVEGLIEGLGVAERVTRVDSLPHRDLSRLMSAARSSRSGAPSWRS